MALQKLPGGATLEVFPDALGAARAGAAFVAECALRAVAERGRCGLALSGGSTPLPMFESLLRESLPWSALQLFQVDERVVPLSDPARNAQQLLRVFLHDGHFPEQSLHLIPVEGADPATSYARTLRDALGTPPVLDLVHLGLGEDGHTASLVPGDAALDVADVDVVEVASYRGHPRVSMTFPVINRARQVLWLVSGEAKRNALAELVSGSSASPAGRVERATARIIADRAAAGGLEAR
ncbi:MAG: 6-phosphogluconolactonase [Myxococcales bacterium]|nr:6-phosphogluconolactonase [Myxococcales bacterium]